MSSTEWEAREAARIKKLEQRDREIRQAIFRLELAMGPNAWVMLQLAILAVIMLALFGLTSLIS